MVTTDRTAEMHRCAEALAADPFSPGLFARAFSPEGDHALLTFYSQLARRARDAGAADLVADVVTDEGRLALLRAAALVGVGDLAAPPIASVVVALLGGGDVWTRFQIIMALRDRRCEAATGALLACLDDERPIMDMWWLSRVSHEAAITLVGVGCLGPDERVRLDRWLRVARGQMISGEGDDRQLAIVALAECGDLDARALARQLADPADPFDPYGELLARIG
jgi:hypothetical protein